MLDEVLVLLRTGDVALMDNSPSGRRLAWYSVAITGDVWFEMEDRQGVVLFEWNRAG